MTAAVTKVRKATPATHDANGVVVGAITPDAANPSAAGGETTRKGRKTREVAALNPYTVWERPDTGRFHMLYTGPHPETGEVKAHRLKLVPPGDKLATKDRGEAERLAADAWVKVQARLGQRRRNEEFVGDRSTARLMPLYTAAVLADTTRNPKTNEQTVQYCNWLMDVLPELANEEDVTTMTTKTATAMRDRLLKTEFPAAARRPAGRPSGGQVRSRLTVIRDFLEWVKTECAPSMKNIIVESGVMKGQKKAKRPQDWYYTPIEVDALLRAAYARPPRKDTLGNAEHLATDFYYGNRSIEGNWLRPEDVDFDLHRIRLHVAKQGRYEDGIRKWFDVREPEDVDRLSEFRWVDMWPAHEALLLAYFKRYRIVERGWKWVFPDYARPGFDLNDPSTHHPRTRGPAQFLKTCFRRAKKELPNMKWRSLHCARHTMVSALANMYKPVITARGTEEPRRYDLHDIQAIIGHSLDSDTTMRIYNKAAYRVPPNEHYNLDWGALAGICREAEARKQQYKGTYTAEVAARYPTIASHPALAHDLEELPVHDEMGPPAVHAAPSRAPSP